MRLLRQKLRIIFYYILKLITSFLFPFYYIKNSKNNKKFRILTYHRVCELPRETNIPYYNVYPKNFQKQMEYLIVHKFNVITLEELIYIKENSIPLPPKSIIITFDDGFRDNYIYAFPILKKYKLRADFFIVSGYIDSNNIFPWLKLDYQSLSHYKKNKDIWVPLSKTELIEMRNFGQKINSHSKSHNKISSLDEIQIEKEIKESKNEIERLLSEPITCYSYPYGTQFEITGKIKTLVKNAGYKVAVTSKLGSNRLNGDFYSLRRIPIYERDSLFEFIKKIYGAYDWLAPFQYVWLKITTSN